MFNLSNILGVRNGSALTLAILKGSPRSCRRSTSLSSMLYPSPAEVERLLVLFPDPEARILSFVGPHAAVHAASLPRVRLEAKTGGRRFRCGIDLAWPFAFTSTATATEPDSARRNAFLAACKTLSQLGLLDARKDAEAERRRFKRALTHDLYRAGWHRARKVSVDIQSSLESPSSAAASIAPPPFDREFAEFVADAAAQRACRGGVWRCKIKLDWPKRVAVEAEGLTQSDAERNASVMACLDLRINRAFDASLRLESFKRLRKRSAARHVHAALPPKRPDFLLWTDASERGYGAYYSRADAGTAPAGERTWLYQPWPHAIAESYLDDVTHILEFYATVSAIYTWARLFRRASVLVHSDSSSVVQYVREGIPAAGGGGGEAGLRYVDRGGNEGLSDEVFVMHLHSFLYKTKCAFDIGLDAVHVNREENRCADSLARLEPEEFRLMEGRRSILSKRAKQLLFLPVFQMFSPFAQTCTS